MANIKISELPTATSFEDDDYVMIVQSNANKKITKQNMYGNYVFSTSEVMIGKWIDGKPLYRQTFTFNDVIQGNSTFELPHNISNIDKIWIDVSNSFWINTSKRSYPILMTHYGTASNNDSATPFADETNIGIITIGGWGSDWEKVITVNYTKTTD